MNVLPVVHELSTMLPGDRKEILMKALADYLNALLLNDFSALVQLLYRVDVPEKKLKEVLLLNPGKDAGELMAALLVERQQQKNAARQTFRFSAGDSNEEKW